MASRKFVATKKKSQADFDQNEKSGENKNSNKTLKERTDMGRPLTPAVMPLAELLNIEGWLNIPSVV